MYHFGLFTSLSNFSWTERKDDGYKRMQRFMMELFSIAILSVQNHIWLRMFSTYCGFWLYALHLSYANIPSKLLQKELYVAFPVTAPSLAGFCLTVFTENPSGPITSTSTIW